MNWKIVGYGIILLYVCQAGHTQQYDAILNDHRRLHTLVPSNHSLYEDISFYLDHRYATYIHECDQIAIQDTSSTDLHVLQMLYNGDCAIYGPDQNDSLAYAMYLDAHLLSKSSTSSILQAECLEKLISYSLLRLTNVDDAETRIADLQELTNNELIQLTATYYKLRMPWEKNGVGRDAVLSSSSKSDFESLLVSCRAQSYYHLEVKVSSFYAALLDNLGHDEEAVRMYNRAAETSRYMGQQYEANVRFASFANIGALEMERENYDKAISVFRQVFDNFQFISDLDNQRMIYKWVSDCYLGIQKKDSAVHYLNLSYKVELDRKALDHKTAVEEIQKKYDKSSVVTELAETTEQLRRRQIYLAIALSLLLLLTLLTFAIYRYQSLKKKAIQQELQNTKIKAAYDATKAKMEGEQKERQVIASVLHDQIASLLTAADLHLKVAKKKSDGHSPYLDKTGDIIKDVNHQVRHLSHQLVSPALMKFGLETALDSLVEQMSTEEGMEITCHSTIGRDRFDDSREIFLYRSCAELIHNSMKHSNGTHIQVDVHRDANGITLQVSDNGQSDTPTSNFGLGLTHIQHRAEALGGSFSFVSNEYGAISTIAIQGKVVSS